MRKQFSMNILKQFTTVFNVFIIGRECMRVVHIFLSNNYEINAINKRFVINIYVLTYT